MSSMQNLLEFLDRNAIAYKRCDHPAVFTTAEAEQHVPPLPGGKAKNLFLRDKGHGRYFLVAVPYGKRVNLAGLAGLLGLRALKFASAPELANYLGITPGAVSMLALLNDAAHRVELIVDDAVWGHEQIQCHPLVNTSTVVLERDALARFFALTGHAPRVLDVPAVST